jgi:hypothetical protein
MNFVPSRRHQADAAAADATAAADAAATFGFAEAAAMPLSPLLTTGFPAIRKGQIRSCK